MVACTSRYVRILLISLAATLAATPDTVAQDEATGGGAATETSEELKRKEEQAKIAEAEQRIAEAEAATAKAQGSETKGLDGEVDVKDGAGYFAEVLAYQSLDAAALEIADAVKGKATKFILTNSFGLNEERALWATVDLRVGVFESRLADLKIVLTDKHGELCGANDQPIPFARMAGPALVSLASDLGALSDVFSFFRADTTLAPYEVDLDDHALLAAVAQALVTNGKTVLIPSLHGGDTGQVATRLSTLQTEGAALEVLREKIKTCSANAWKVVEALRKEVAKHQKDEAKRKAAQKKLDDALKAPVVKLRLYAEKEVPSARSALRDFILALVTPPKDGKPSPFEMVATVDTMKQHPDASFLYLKIVGEGGEVQITKSMWTGGRVSYIGGSSSVYFLTDGNGIVKASGTNTKFRRGWYGTRGGVKGLEVE